MKKTALFLIDVQVDFCDGGALAVSQGNQVVPVCNQLINMAQAAGCPVLASRDWHPADHCSFKQFGGPWPVHCVAGQPGANFNAELKLPADVTIVSKGTNPKAEAYSAFDGTTAAETLRAAGVEHLVMCGLATDYCVKFSVLDALKAGFDVTVVAEGCRAVNVQPGDDKKALEEMEAAGATVCQLSEVKF